VILDGRNIYDPKRMERMGFEYHSVGRAPVRRRSPGKNSIQLQFAKEPVEAALLRAA
jgi:hypothetical protein